MTPRRLASLGALLLAACGREGGGGRSDPFTKPSPTVASTFEGQGAEAWAARLRDPDAETRAEAVHALASLGAAGVERADAMRPLLADTVASVRFAALMAVQRLDDVPGPLAEDAVRRLADPVEGVRRLARDVATGLGAKAVPALRGLLASEDEGVRRAALSVLVSLRGAAADAIPDLERLLRSEDAAVQDDATDALSAIGAAAVPALRKAVGDARDDVAALAAIALGRIGEPAAVAGEDLAAAARRGPVRRVAVDALSRLGPAGRSILERLSKDPDERLRAAASDALDHPR